MKVRVFYRQSPLENTPSVETHTEVFDVKKELEGLKKELETTKNEQEKLNLKRKITRLEFFDNLQEGKLKLEKNKEIQSILKGKTAESFLGSDLHMLNKRGVDIASLTLVSEANPSQTADSSKMVMGDRFVVNFGGNQSLARKIGAGDILPPEVTKVKINGVECERRNIPRPGYYNDTVRPPYQKIYDGYSIEIVERNDSITSDELKASNLAAEKRWEKIRAQDMISLNDKKPFTELQEEQELGSEVERLIKEGELKRLDSVFYGGEKQKFAIDAFTKFGWTQEQSTGIVANLIAESGMNPMAIGDGGAAYGLAQWHPDRQENFERVFQKSIKESSFEEQLAFVNYELRNSESMAGELLSLAHSSGEAADIITRYYERPADKEGNSKMRVAIAQDLSTQLS